MHTPRPWHWDEYRNLCGPEPKNRVIAQLIFSESDNVEDGSDDANASLIESAPDLLQALKRLGDSTGWECYCTSGDLPCAICNAVTIIKKVEP
jgi:hypothetical protein